MSNNKQTAVEFLYDQIWKTPITEWGKLLHQAKQMEKEQSFEIFKAGQESMEEGGQGFDQYYNENFRIR